MQAEGRSSVSEFLNGVKCRSSRSPAIFLVLDYLQCASVTVEFGDLNAVSTESGDNVAGEDFEKRLLQFSSQC